MRHRSNTIRSYVFVVETSFEYIVKSIVKIPIFVNKVCTYLGQLSKDLTLE